MLVAVNDDFAITFNPFFQMDTSCQCAFGYIYLLSHAMVLFTFDIQRFLYV